MGHYPTIPRQHIKVHHPHRPLSATLELSLDLCDCVLTFQQLKKGRIFSEYIAFTLDWPLQTRDEGCAQKAIRAVVSSPMHRGLSRSLCMVMSLQVSTCVFIPNNVKIDFHVV